MELGGRDGMGARFQAVKLFVEECSMPGKKITVLPSELVSKIDEHRGDLDRGEFLNVLIDSYLQQDSADHAAQKNSDGEYVTEESLTEFERGIKELLRNFLEFFVSYGLEIGPKTGDSSGLESLAAKLKK